MIDTAVGVLNVPELEALVSLNTELALRYQEIADDPAGDPQTRQTAEALAGWRRARARYFREECAETERVEAAHTAEPSAALAAAELESHAVSSRAARVSTRSQPGPCHRGAA
jgi:hypothetical protein